MSRKRVGLQGKILMFLGKMLCLDPIAEYGGDPSKWTVCSRSFKLRMIIFVAFFGAFHCRVRIYDVLVLPTVTFESYVLLGCSSVAMFVIVSQMVITAFTAGQYVKIVRVLRDIYLEESYGVVLNDFDTLALPENIILALTVVQSFVSSTVTSHTWHQMIAKAILDTYVEVTLAMSTFLYFNNTHMLKRCFVSLYGRSKEIPDVKHLKQLWKDYLKLHSTVGKVGRVEYDRKT